MPEAYNNQVGILDELFPKVIANHVSKLPGLEAAKYTDILALASNEDIPLNDRLHQLAFQAGNTALADELIAETSVMRLVALGQEARVDDLERQAAYARSDANQIKTGFSNKNLDFYLANGVEIIFDPEARERAREYCRIEKRDVPLIETLKAHRLFNINGFDESRVMYAVHDMIDHAWLFDQLREDGIMSRYSDFLQSVDMTEDAFLYSRQAELLASVGFGARRWPVAKEQCEVMVLDETHVLTLLDSTDDIRTHQAAITLRQMFPAQREQAIFIIENMAIQLTDERRRWGAVKQADNGGERKPMALLEPLYIALMIDSLNLLQHAKSYGSVQLAATMEVETVLEEAVHDQSSESIIHIPIPRIIRPNEVNVASEKAQWVREHLSVSTSYNKIG